MSGEKHEVSREPETSGSDRLRIARAALKAALGVSGVLEADPGPSRLRVTADPPSGVLVGVSVTALPDGRYGVDLSLVAEMVSLPELAEEVRARVLERAKRERLARLLGTINVEFAYVITREELAAVAAIAEEEAEMTLASRELEATAAAEAQADTAAAQAAATEPPGGPEAAAAPGPTPTPTTAPGSTDVGGGASPAGEVAAAIAAQQAAIATDQAALAAKQAALAAEQAALAAGSEAVVGSRATAAGSAEPDHEGRLA